MTEKKIRNLSILGLTWPIFVELLLHMLMGNADTLMLSQYSDNSVASVGVANRIIYIIILIFGVIATGTSVLVAHHLGAKEFQKASEVAVVSIFGNLILGLVLSVMIYLFGEQILRVMGLPQELFSEAMLYIIFVGGFSFIPAVILTVSAVLRSHGFTKDVMFVTIGMNLFDVIGNFLFIFGPFGIPILGVFGVAITTTFSKAIGLIVILVILTKRVEYPLPFSNIFSLPMEHLQRLFKIGVPSACELLSYHTSQLAITYITTFLGTQALTTKVYAENLMMFIYLFSMAISQGTQILIGHLAGARHFQDVYERCIYSIRISFAISLGMGIIMYIFSNQLFEIFTDNPAIIQSGSLLLLVTILLEPGRSFNLVILGALRALGDIHFAVYLGIISMWGISVVMSYLLAIYFELGLLGIWISFVVDEWLRGLVLLRRWKLRLWLRKYNHHNEFVS
ncbi:MATE family efflux transporter [Paenibacillus sedimenti]|uniref:MATE family efflux transporter n=1 Tax=Paenibacillus sedimenti TaxID=2770274 RepID=A0A926KVV7_9BACL|nr:MATE family efflux transporter [Paenibacillus sedimenti]MBD0382910.1 MATE family efflux transporter [Paenibacillus sedimenti]